MSHIRLCNTVFVAYYYNAVNINLDQGNLVDCFYLKRKKFANTKSLGIACLFLVRSLSNVLISDGTTKKVFGTDNQQNWLKKQLFLVLTKYFVLLGS